MARQRLCQSCRLTLWQSLQRALIPAHASAQTPTPFAPGYSSPALRPAASSRRPFSTRSRLAAAPPPQTNTRPIDQDRRAANEQFDQQSTSREASRSTTHLDPLRLTSTHRDSPPPASTYYDSEAANSQVSAEPLSVTRDTSEQELLVFPDLEAAQDEADDLLTRSAGGSWEQLEASRQLRKVILDAIREKQMGLDSTSGVRIDGDILPLEEAEAAEDDMQPLKVDDFDYEVREGEEAVLVDDEFAIEDEEWENSLQEPREDEPSLILEDDLDTSADRLHLLTRAGKFGTLPSTVFLPKAAMVTPIAQMLSKKSPKHLQQSALAMFGGPGLPHGLGTPKSKRPLAQKSLPLLASHGKMAPMDADLFMSTMMPPIYASVMSVLVEIRKRLGKQWLRSLLSQDGGPRVIDLGGGGAGILAWRELVKAELALMRDEGIEINTKAPFRQSTVITGSDTLQHRASRLLDNTTFLPRMPDYLHSGDTQTRPFYDVVIAPHQLWQHSLIRIRREAVAKIWRLADPAGGVVLFLEKGVPQGFEAIAQARRQILNSFIASSSPSPSASLDTATTEVEAETAEPEAIPSTPPPPRPLEAGQILAPCTNHLACPMYPTVGSALDWRQFCHFSQRYIRPPFLQAVYGASRRNHEDVKFSYLAVRRGVDTRPEQTTDTTERAFAGFDKPLSTAEEARGGEGGDEEASPLSFPRLILPPLKRQGHVLLDMCTPSGSIERWTVPRSFGKVAFHDARKAGWGDLWALGAKTRLDRNLKVRERDLKALEERKMKRLMQGKAGGRRKKFEEWKAKQREKDEERAWDDEQGNGTRRLGKGWEKSVDRVERRRGVKGGRKLDVGERGSLSGDERVEIWKGPKGGEEEE